MTKIYGQIEARGMPWWSCGWLPLTMLLYLSCYVFNISPLFPPSIIEYFGLILDLEYQTFKNFCTYVFSFESLSSLSSSFLPTVWLKWIATLCGRYASPPPLWKKFSSSFRFVQFSHWTVKTRKTSKKELKN